jgi:hypothetical protein
MLFNIDCDGVLLSNTHEDAFFKKIVDESCSIKSTSHEIFDWYTKLVDTTPVRVNHPVMRFLQTKKEEGHAIRLWTNRMYTLRDATIRNLGDYKSIFDSFQFHSGLKSASIAEGVVVDNGSKYLNCGETGILYPTFR